MADTLYFIDSHCHLQHCYGPGELEDSAAGLGKKLLFIIDICLDINEIRQFKRYRLPGNVLAAYGLYPEQAPGADDRLFSEFAALVEEGSPAAIGEVGLDYFHQYGTREQQERLFRRQVELAVEKSLPLIVHSRSAYQDTLRVLSSYRFNRGVVLHCYGYGPSEADEFLARGFYLSFAGNLTYKSAHDLRETALRAPLDRVLLETDAPYLSPMPHRGDRNYPDRVEHTYRFLAGLRQMELPALCERIGMNFGSVFGAGIPKNSG